MENEIETGILMGPIFFFEKKNQKKIHKSYILKLIISQLFE